MIHNISIIIMLEVYTGFLYEHILSLIMAIYFENFTIALSL